MQNLFLFNPENELSIANGKISYMPKANIMTMVRELAFLPAYFATPGDYVLVPEPLNGAFLKSREDIFEISDITRTWNDVQNLQLNEIRPWGWSPRMHYLMSDLKTRCSEEFRQSVMAEWKEERRELYSRREAMECLKKLSERVTAIDLQIIPRVYTSLAAIREASEAGSIAVKAPWSSSGRGLQFIPQGKMTRKEDEIISGFLNKQGYVMVEKRLERVLDFAMEFEMDNHSNVSYLGLSVFSTSKRGEYESNLIASESRLEREITRYVDPAYLKEVREQIIPVLVNLFHGQYVGCLGVDMMIYLDKRGQYAIQPCVEINLRYNMGILALHLQRHLEDGKEGFFTIRFSNQAREIFDTVSERQLNYPLVVQKGKIVSGYVNLTPVSPNTCFVAELLVG